MSTVQERIKAANTNIAAAVESLPGDLSRLVDWMGADRFAAKLAGRATWEAVEILLLAQALDVTPSRLVDGAPDL